VSPPVFDRSAPRPDKLESLARALLDGHDSATRPFLALAGPVLLRVVRQVLGSRHPDLEDVLQEALLGALDALPRFRGDCSLGHFLRRIALLSALAARRRQGLREKVTPLGLPSELEELPAPTEPKDAHRRALLMSLLDELPTPLAEVMGLHCILGYTVAEMAASTGVSPNTVKSRLSAGKQKLRRRLSADHELWESLRGVS